MFLTVAQLQRLTVDDFVVLAPPPSKADPFLQVWGAKPIYIRYSPAGGINMAFWIAQLELWFPVAAERRDTTPLFVDNAGHCLKSEWWSGLFQRLLSTLMAAAEAKQYSTHSFRIMLACGAWAAGHSPGAIQALCRWRSLDSLRTYVSWDPAQYSSMVTAALTQAARPTQVQNLPTLDPAELLAQLQQFQP